MDAETTLQTADLLALVTAAITAVIEAQESPGTLRPAQLLTAALGVPGSDGAIISTPTTAVTVAANSVLIPGTIMLTWAS